MLTVIIHADYSIEVLGADPGLHLVVVSEPGQWTDSPDTFTPATEDEQAEQIAAYRNAGFEDRNP